MGAESGRVRRAGVRAGLRRRYASWLRRRMPPAREITLNQRRIFIFPSAAGLFYLVCLLVMLLTAINFQNNLTYAVAFLLFAQFIVAILHTYANLSGLTIRALGAQPAFPRQQTRFELQLERHGRRERYGLHLRWPGSSEALVNLSDQVSTGVRLHLPVGERGWFRPGRLLLESTYPLGLLRAWTWVDLDLQALVYPQPLAAARASGDSSEGADGVTAPITGNDDFQGFRDYRHGDSLRQVYWKGLARGQSLQSKQYVSSAQESVWLDWEQFPGLGIEQRLSHLCYWALQFAAAGFDYGLQLPGLRLEPDSGAGHRERVLRELALFRAQEGGR